MRTLLISILASLSLSGVALAQSTAFTYQGELKAGGAPAGGPHDVRFKLFDAATAGTQIGTTQCVDNVTLTGGKFTTIVDFGAQFASTAPRFLEIEVRADSGLDCANNSGYTTLSPRQAITPAPRAAAASVANALSAPDGSPSNAVFVSNTGNVGIGTTTPAVPLHIVSTSLVPALHISSPFASMQLQDTGPDASQTGYVSYRNATGTETAWTGFGTAGSPHFSIVNARPSADVVLTTTRDIVVNTGGGERIRINTLGSVGIGITPVNFKLDVAGSIRCTTLTQTSSAAFKDDVVPLAAGLGDLMKLEPVSYVWNDQAPEDSRGKHDLGFIAEDVANVLPDAVACDAEGKPVGIDYSRITVLAVKAIKEQQARLREQQEELQLLHARLALLEDAMKK